jgi:hypothetical protein
MGPAATTTAHPPVPRRPIIGSQPGASRTPTAPAGLRPVLDPPTRSPGSAAAGEQGTPRPLGTPAGQSGMPYNRPGTRAKPQNPPFDTAPLLQG